MISQNCRDRSRCVTLLSGTMYHSTALFWSKTGSMPTQNFLFCTFLHTPPSSTPSRNFFLHGDGRYMTFGHTTVFRSLRPWSRPVTSLMQPLYRDGFVMQGGSSKGALLMKTLPVMWMKYYGLIQQDGEMIRMQMFLFLYFCFSSVRMYFYLFTI